MQSDEFVYFMISTDKPEDNKKFAEEHGAGKFVILSDPEKTTTGAYGVLMGPGFAKRTTFYVDKKGAIQKIEAAVKPMSAGKDMVEAMKELGIPVNK